MMAYFFMTIFQFAQLYDFHQTLILKGKYGKTTFPHIILWINHATVRENRLTGNVIGIF